jgi:hypothetical protein
MCTNFITYTFSATCKYIVEQENEEELKSDALVMIRKYAVVSCYEVLSQHPLE